MPAAATGPSSTQATARAGTRSGWPCCTAVPGCARSDGRPPPAAAPSVAPAGARRRPLGAPATLTGGPFGRRSRVPLAQAFVPLAGGRDGGPAFVVAANHFKSKGCGDAEGADRDQGDGQACWNATRVDSARRL